MSQYRSPGGPPSRDASPWPDTRIRVPFSIPAGIVTSISCFARTSPSPRHVPHGLVIFVPAPPHDGHADCSMKKPAFRPTTPRPAHVVHADRDVPGFAPDPLHVAH